MRLRTHIVQVISEYRSDTKELLERYESLNNNSPPNNDILEKIQQDKEYIIDKYLAELEALSLYLYHKAIDEHICREYFLDPIVGIFCEDDFVDVKQYIDREREKSPKYFKYLIKLSQKWIEEINNKFE